jgi:hypothetical protein
MNLNYAYLVRGSSSFVDSAALNFCSDLINHLALKRQAILICLLPPFHGRIFIVADTRGSTPLSKESDHALASIGVDCGYHEFVFLLRNLFRAFLKEPQERDVGVGTPVAKPAKVLVLPGQVALPYLGCDGDEGNGTGDNNGDDRSRIGHIRSFAFQIK